MEKMTDEELLQEIGDAEAHAKQILASVTPLREELLKRQLETGAINVESADWVTTLKKSPYSMPWLKKAFGYEAKDLPPEVMEEKVMRSLALLALLLGGCGRDDKTETDTSHIYTGYKWVVVCQGANRQKCWLREGRLPIKLNANEEIMFGSVEGTQQYERRD